MKLAQAPSTGKTHRVNLEHGRTRCGLVETAEIPMGVT